MRGSSGILTKMVINFFQARNLGMCSNVKTVGARDLFEIQSVTENLRGEFLP